MLLLYILPLGKARTKTKYLETYHFYNKINKSYQFYHIAINFTANKNTMEPRAVGGQPSAQVVYLAQEKGTGLSN